MRTGNIYQMTTAVSNYILLGEMTFVIAIIHKANYREGAMSIGKKLISAFFILLLSFIFAGVLIWLLLLFLGGILGGIGESEFLVLIFFPPVVAGFISLFVSWKLLFFDKPTFTYSDDLVRLIVKGVMISASIGVGLVFLFVLFLRWLYQ